MNLAAIQNALASMKKEAGERRLEEAARAPDLQGLIEALSARAESPGEALELQKAALMRRRSNLMVAKVLAGLDGLASQEA